MRKVTPLSGYHLDPLFTPAEVQSTVARLADVIRRDYGDKNPVLLGVLKGCFVFMADLVRALDIPLEIEFLSLSSCGPGRTQSRGRIEVIQGLRKPVRGRHVLIVEDIVDTGITVDFTLRYVRRRRPASVRVCALFDKPAYYGKKSNETPYMHSAVNAVHILNALFICRPSHHQKR